MKEWVVRFWGFVALAALIALIATTALHDHEPAAPGLNSSPPRPAAYVTPPITPDPEASLGSFHLFFRTSDSESAQRMLDAAHLRLAVAAREEPEALRAADVLLQRGLNPLETEQLLLRYQLDYLACEARTPLPDGTIMSMAFTTGGPIPRLPLSIAEMVTSDIGRVRQRLLWKAQKATNPGESARQRDVALRSEIGVYRVEVVGRQRDLAALMSEPDVRGVVSEVDGARAEVFARLKSEMPRTMPPIIRTRLQREGTQTISPPRDPK